MDDEWFYINPEGERAFAETYEFAETFHHDRALVKNASGFQISIRKETRWPNYPLNKYRLKVNGVGR